MEGSTLLRAATTPVKTNLLILDCVPAILALAPSLQEVATRCGQPGAMHWLPYFLSSAVLGWRSPRLVLILRAEEDSARGLRADDIEAAALFFEYEFCGRRTGIIATGDAVGFSSVVAPWRDRARVAAIAARALLEAGASSVVATYEGYADSHLGPVLEGIRGARIATRQRRVDRVLALRPTLDETLTQMGKSTRNNLRRYRRRINAHLGCEFVADAAAALRGADLAAINKGSLNPSSLEAFEARVRAASELPGSFLCGLRSSEGHWLALLGGWRQDRMTVLQWQMNTAGYEKFSLSTIARSYFMEHEISVGAESLLLYGGTPHPMRHAFRTQAIGDLVVQRKGLRTFAFGAFCRLYDGPSRRLGKGNFVTATLRDTNLRWRSAAATEEAKGPSRAELSAGAGDRMKFRARSA